MKILISGISGFIGNELKKTLIARGAEVYGLSRAQDKPHTIHWDIERGELDAAQLAGFDAVVHLAGENLADGRWTDEKKRRIIDSRVKGTTLLCEKLAALEKPPCVLLSASAIGFYGDRGAETLTEDSAVGTGFLAETCLAWEAATKAAEDAGIRTVHYRIGLVLSPDGGALAKMLTLFKLGLGGKLGSGEQFWSWIALDDLIGGMLFCLDNENVRGAVNATAPHPVINAVFTDTLGEVLHRPTIFSVPKFALEIAFGEMADEALLSSAKVLPERLSKADYAFKFNELKSALAHLLN